MSILKAALCFIILYVGITIAISFINALLLGLEFSGYNRMDSLFKENRLVALRGYFLLFSAASSRILELMSGFFVIFLIWIYTRRVTAGFLFLQCTGYKNLKFLAEINNKIDDKKIRNIMELVGLDPDIKTKVKDYSLGMKQKLGIAQAIMEDQNIIT